MTPEQIAKKEEDARRAWPHYDLAVRRAEAAEAKLAAVEAHADTLRKLVAQLRAEVDAAEERAQFLESRIAQAEEKQR